MSKLRLRIRDFRPEDFEAIYGIDQICFPLDIAFSRGEFAFCLNHPQGIARVAEGVDGIAGFVLARKEGPFRAHILTLDVVPEMRRRGVGTRLMNDLHHALKQQSIGLLVLEVAVKNVGAQRLYENLGYEYRGLLAGYYRGREDAYRMTRNRSAICGFSRSNFESVGEK